MYNMSVDKKKNVSFPRIEFKQKLLIKKVF